MRIATGLLLGVATSLAACAAPSIYSVRIPLDGKTLEAPANPARISVEDLRPANEKKTHIGGGLRSCQRWYGDTTYVPSKVEYLVKLLGSRLPPQAEARLTLRRFDTVEFCDNMSDQASSAAAGRYLPAAPERDHVRIHIAGDVNGRPFDVSSTFVYGELRYGFTQMPAANPVYVERLRAAFAEAADSIAKIAFPSQLPAAAN